MNPRRFRLDASARRPDSGRVLIAGSPLRVFTLGTGGVRVVEAIERGDTPPAGHEPLTDRLLDAGAIHPVVDLVPVGASLLIRMHEVTEMSIRELRDLMGDRRTKYRLSDAQGKPKPALDQHEPGAQEPSPGQHH